MNHFSAPHRQILPLFYLEDTRQLFLSCPSYILYIEVIFRASIMHFHFFPLSIRPHRRNASLSAGTFALGRPSCHRCDLLNLEVQGVPS